MALTLAGVPLIVPRPDLVQRIARTIPVEDACPWSVRAWPGAGLIDVAYPSGVRTPRDLKINALFWPSGASRWAYGHFLADGLSLARIRDAANGEGGDQPVAISLRMTQSEDGDPEVLNTKLYLLRAAPLSQVPPEEGFEPNNLYLLTLVDVRYYWQDVPASDFEIEVPNPSPTTWADCFNKLAGDLGVELDFGDPIAQEPTEEDSDPDPIPADTADPAYLYPDVTLNAPGESAAVLLDALAWNIGKRIVRKLDGSVCVMGFDRSLAIRKADDLDNADRRLRGGGDLFRDVL